MENKCLSTEAMGIEWQTMMAQGKAKADLKVKITWIFSAHKKKAVIR